MDRSSSTVAGDRFTPARPWRPAPSVAAFLTALCFLGACSGSSRPSGEDPNEAAERERLVRVASPSPSATEQRPLITYAWWLTIEFRPVDSTLFGIPVADVNKEWTSASLLSRSLLSPEAQADPSDLDDPQFGFELEGDFDHDGVANRAGVGVFRDATGLEGRFLLIVEKLGSRWQLDTVFPMRGRAGFSVLSHTVDSSAIRWWGCMECGDFVNVVHTPDGYRLSPP